MRIRTIYACWLFALLCSLAFTAGAQEQVITTSLGKENANGLSVVMQKYGCHPLQIAAIMRDNGIATVEGLHWMKPDAPIQLSPAACKQAPADKETRDASLAVWKQEIAVNTANAGRARQPITAVSTPTPSAPQVSMQREAELQSQLNAARSENVQLHAALAQKVTPSSPPDTCLADDTSRALYVQLASMGVDLKAAQGKLVTAHAAAAKQWIWTLSLSLIVGAAGLLFGCMATGKIVIERSNEREVGELRARVAQSDTAVLQLQTENQRIGERFQQDGAELQRKFFEARAIMEERLATQETLVVELKRKLAEASAAPPKEAVLTLVPVPSGHQAKSA